ncbi:MAG: ABC-2 family transporter protein [Roseburia sp.]|nr:ABC-2 family transporter protein [Roseburia sp.]
MMKNIRKNLRVLSVLVRLRFQRLMVFRFDFFVPFLIDGSLFVIQLLAFAGIYGNVDSIGGWGQGEMTLYIGTFSLLNALNMTFYFFGVNGIPEKVKSGELDLYLTKPVSPLFRLTFEYISPGSIPLILMSIGIILYGIRTAGIPVTGRLAGAYLFWVFVMVILYYEVEVVIRSVSLYLVSTARMDQLEDAGINLCMKLPGIAFHGIFKVVFYLLLPYGIMATLPVQSLIGEMNRYRGVYGILVVGLFTRITHVIWRRGLRHYNSASS